jgi:hypothetical protein
VHEPRVWCLSILRLPARPDRRVVTEKVIASDSERGEVADAALDLLHARLRFGFHHDQGLGFRDEGLGFNLLHARLRFGFHHDQGLGFRV